MATRIEYTIKRKDYKDTMNSYLDFPHHVSISRREAKEQVRRHVQNLNFSSDFEITFLKIS